MVSVLASIVESKFPFDIIFMVDISISEVTNEGILKSIMPFKLIIDILDMWFEIESSCHRIETCCFDSSSYAGYKLITIPSTFFCLFFFYL